MLKIHQPIEFFASLPPSASRSELWLPQTALSSCVRAVISRDTRDVALQDQQRYNYLPASPVCSIVWYLSGHCEVIQAGFPAESTSPRTSIGPITFCGPFTHPTISWNPGPMHSMVLLLLPDALSALTGINPGAYLNRCLPAEEVLAPSWMAMCKSVAAAADDECRVSRIESFLLPLWSHARPQQGRCAQIYADWSHGLAVRAATSGLGRSLRQIERRIKQWTGQPLRELRGLGRSEQAFFDAVVASRSGEVNWSDVATNSGYADQSHLCRQTRQITGFSPEELRRRIYADEAFWAYRLWGFSESHFPR